MPTVAQHYNQTAAHGHLDGTQPAAPVVLMVFRRALIQPLYSFWPAPRSLISSTAVEKRGLPASVCTCCTSTIICVGRLPTRTRRLCVSSVITMACLFASSMPHLPTWGGQNLEAAAREVRYAAARRYVRELCAEAGCPRTAARILTAPHGKRSLPETFFMNAIKGAGPAGLSSIPRRRNIIVRPLIDMTHEELCRRLEVAGIPWREDESNQDTSYLRNYVRHRVVPVARERNANLARTLGATCDILGDEDAFMSQLAATALRQCTRRRRPRACGDRWHASVCGRDCHRATHGALGGKNSSTPRCGLRCGMWRQCLPAWQPGLVRSPCRRASMPAWSLACSCAAHSSCSRDPCCRLACRAGHYAAR